MKKLLTITTLTFCAFLVSCSSGSVVGKWSRADNNQVTEFTSDGKVVFYDQKGEKSATGWTYTVDDKSSPSRVTIDANGNVSKCIYKISGSKLTMNCSVGKGGDFPKDFDGTTGAMMNYERK